MLLINLNQNKSNINKYLSSTLIDKVEKKLKNNKKIILYLNKRGSHSSLICNDCQYYYKCPNCDVALKIHFNTKLQCHLCGYKENINYKCKKCN
jgi:primosomal protein N' (replication factor Y)